MCLFHSLNSQAEDESWNPQAIVYFYPYLPPYHSPSVSLSASFPPSLSLSPIRRQSGGQQTAPACESDLSRWEEELMTKPNTQIEGRVRRWGEHGQNICAVAALGCACMCICVWVCSKTKACITNAQINYKWLSSKEDLLSGGRRCYWTTLQPCHLTKRASTVLWDNKLGCVINHKTWQWFSSLNKL